MTEIEVKDRIRQVLQTPHDLWNLDDSTTLESRLTDLFFELDLKSESEPESIMIPFEPKGINFIGDVKSRVDNFIRECKSLDQDQKAKLIEELGSNWYDERFGSADVFFKYGISFAVKKWKNQNFELKELWEKIAVANASVGDSPNEVADRVIETHKNNFKSE